MHSGYHVWVVVLVESTGIWDNYLRTEWCCHQGQDTEIAPQKIQIVETYCHDRIMHDIMGIAQCRSISSNRQ
jgi:hypothetical protein